MQKPLYIIIALILAVTFVPVYNFPYFHYTQRFVPREQIVQSTTTSLLIIYGNPDDIKTAQQLLTYRPDISSQNITYVNWQNNTYLLNIVDNGSYLLFNEFWIIIGDMNTSNLPLGFVQLFVKIPTLSTAKILLLSPDISVLSTYLYDNIFSSYLNILNCAPAKNTNIANITITYPLATNLSSLLNTTIPNTESFISNMTYSSCTFNPNIYRVAQLAEVANTTSYQTPLVYQPTFKSHITVGLFSLAYELNQTLFTSAVTKDYNSIIRPQISTSFPALINKQQYNASLFYVLATLVSRQYSSQLSSSPAYPATNGSNMTLVTNPVYNTGNINFFGLYLPQVPKWAYPAIITTSAIGLIAIVLRRFWVFIAGTMIFIGTLIYHPGRKLDAVEVLSHVKRQKIMDLLNTQAEHGETFRNLSEKLGMPVPTLLWHLKILKEFGFIQMFKIRRETVIVAQDFVKKFDPIIKELDLSFKSSQAYLFKAFLTNLKPNQIFTIKDVISYTKWNIRTAKRHLDHLCALKILDTTKDKNTFSINPKYCTALKLLRGSTTNSKYLKVHT